MAGVYTPGEPSLIISAMTGAELIPLDTTLARGVTPQTAATPSGATGFGAGLQVIAAAGATQGTATNIAAGPSIVLVTVTASTEGVRLPTVSTGARYWVIPSATVGVKVYARATGQKISTATTATTAYGPIAKGGIGIFVGLNSTTWAAGKIT